MRPGPGHSGCSICGGRRGGAPTRFLGGSGGLHLGRRHPGTSRKATANPPSPVVPGQGVGGGATGRTFASLPRQFPQGPPLRHLPRHSLLFSRMRYGARSFREGSRNETPNHAPRGDHRDRRAHIWHRAVRRRLRSDAGPAAHLEDPVPVWDQRGRCRIVHDLGRPPTAAAADASPSSPWRRGST